MTNNNGTIIRGLSSRIYTNADFGFIRIPACLAQTMLQPRPSHPPQTCTCEVKLLCTKRYRYIILRQLV